MTILYTLYKNTYIDLSHLDSTKGVTCYVNTTNRCPCACTFCLRQTKEMMENNSLWLKEEPSKEMIIEEFKKYERRPPGGRPRWSRSARGSPCAPPSPGLPALVLPPKRWGSGGSGA